MQIYNNMLQTDTGQGFEKFSETTEYFIHPKTSKCWAAGWSFLSVVAIETFYPNYQCMACHQFLVMPVSKHQSSSSLLSLPALSGYTHHYAIMTTRMTRIMKPMFAVDFFVLQLKDDAPCIF